MKLKALVKRHFWTLIKEMPSQVRIRSSGFTWAMSAGDNKDDSWTLEVDLLRANCTPKVTPPRQGPVEVLDGYFISLCNGEICFKEPLCCYLPNTAA